MARPDKKGIAALRILGPWLRPFDARTCACGKRNDLGSPDVAARILASALAALVIAGCAVAPKYRRPPIDAPVATRGQVRPADAASIADLPWWQVFEDPVLQQLVATAIRENYDLKTAAARVEQSRQLIGVARAEVLGGYVAGTGPRGAAIAAGGC